MKPEEIPTPETDAAVESAQRNAPGTGSVFWAHVATGIRRKAESLERRALAAERARDELRDSLNRTVAMAKKLADAISIEIARTKPTHQPE